MEISERIYKQEESIPFDKGVLQYLWWGVIESTEETIYLRYFESMDECRIALNDFIKTFKPKGKFKQGIIINEIYEKITDGELNKRKRFENKWFLYKGASIFLGE